MLALVFHNPFYNKPFVRTRRKCFISQVQTLLGFLANSLVMAEVLQENSFIASQEEAGAVLL